MKFLKFSITIVISLLICGCSTGPEPGEEDETETYSLSVAASPSNGGSVTPSNDTYEEGTEVTVEATSEDGYNFSEWTGDQSSTNNPFSFTIDEDTDLTANFEDQRSSYTVGLQVIDTQDTVNLSFGQAQDATEQYDESMDEEAPPPPPEGALHAYFEIPDYNLFHDFRSNTTTQVEWSLKYQVGSGESLTLEWDINPESEIAGNLLLSDDESSFEVNMQDQDSYSIDNTQSGTLIIKRNSD